MNLIRRVWLPPDGDSRLVRFQEELARRANRWEWTAVPPFVHLDNDVEIPVGPVETGSWLLDEGQPVLQALDSGRSMGVFRFGLASTRPLIESDLAGLPAPPSWKWTHGRLGVLELTLPQDDAAFALWTWTSLRGWKSGLSKE